LKASAIRLRATTAIVVTLLSITVVLPLVLGGASSGPRPGIDKSGKEISADLDRMFPCPGRDQRTIEAWEKNPNCAAIWEFDTKGTSAPIDRIEAFPKVYEIDGLREIRHEPSPVFVKAMPYLFPQWRQGGAWLSRSIESLRRSPCPKVAHVGGVWIFVRYPIAQGDGKYTEIIFTRFAEEMARWKKLDEIFCDGPLVIEEISTR
jgi:hypothetical protein